MTPSTSRRATLACVGALGAILVGVALLYHPVLHFPFLALDDDYGVASNPGIRDLSWRGLRFLFFEDQRDWRWFPLSYASFEGEIPKGEYGAGTVEIWDRGTYELLEEKRNGGLTFRLDGERAHGVWTLVPAHLDGKEQNWLLLRKDADSGGGAALRPQLATLTERLPEGPEWLFEPKWDGYRAIVDLHGGEARLTSRNGKDLTERFREVARNVARAVRTPFAVLDGEVCALDEEGTARFEALQRGSGPLVLMAFDLLELDGEPIHERPQRRVLVILQQGRVVGGADQPGLAAEEAEQVLVVHVEAEVAGGGVEMRAVYEDAEPLLGIEMHGVVFQSQCAEHSGIERNRHRSVPGNARS